MKKLFQVANFLDFTFFRNAEINTEMSEEGRVVLFLKHTGIFALLAQRVFHKPAVTKIELDEIGSFVWTNIDGQINVYELGQKLKLRFEDKAEPLYERLSVFMKQLHKLGFIQQAVSKK